MNHTAAKNMGTKKYSYFRKKGRTIIIKKLYCILAYLHNLLLLYRSKMILKQDAISQLSVVKKSCRSTKMAKGSTIRVYFELPYLTCKKQLYTTTVKNPLQCTSKAYIGSTLLICQSLADGFYENPPPVPPLDAIFLSLFIMNVSATHLLSADIIIPKSKN